MANIFPPPPMLIRTLNENKWNDAKTEMFIRGVDSIVVEIHGIWRFVVEINPDNPHTVFRKTYRNGNLILSEEDIFIIHPNVNPDSILEYR
jgi:hypothetical protein